MVTILRSFAFVQLQISLLCQQGLSKKHDISSEDNEVVKSGKEHLIKCLEARKCCVCQSCMPWHLHKTAQLCSPSVVCMAHESAACPAIINSTIAKPPYIFNWILQDKRLSSKTSLPANTGTHVACCMLKICQLLDPAPICLHVPSRCSRTKPLERKQTASSS